MLENDLNSDDINIKQNSLFLMASKFSNGKILSIWGLVIHFVLCKRMIINRDIDKCM